MSDDLFYITALQFAAISCNAGVVQAKHWWVAPIGMALSMMLLYFANRRLAKKGVKL